MSEYKPLLGVYYGTLDIETKEKLEYYERNKKKELLPIVSKILNAVFFISAILTFFPLTIYAARKVSGLWGLGEVLSILIGLFVWILCCCGAYFLLTKIIYPPVEARDQRAEADNEILYEIVMSGTVMDRAHRVERMKAEIARMQADGTWKDEYLPDELKESID